MSESKQKKEMTLEQNLDAMTSDIFDTVNKYVQTERMHVTSALAVLEMAKHKIIATVERARRPEPSKIVPARSNKIIH